MCELPGKRDRTVACCERPVRVAEHPQRLGQVAVDGRAARVVDDADECLLPLRIDQGETCFAVLDRNARIAVMKRVHQQSHPDQQRRVPDRPGKLEHLFGERERFRCAAGDEVKRECPRQHSEAMGRVRQDLEQLRGA